jgi:hypothetical protein
MRDESYGVRHTRHLMAFMAHFATSENMLKFSLYSRWHGNYAVVTLYYKSASPDLPTVLSLNLHCLLFSSLPWCRPGKSSPYHTLDITAFFSSTPALQSAIIIYLFDIAIRAIEISFAFTRPFVTRCLQ